MKVAIYSEHCALAGRQCWNEDKIERNSDDLVIYEGTPQELYQIAANLRGRGIYNDRVADTLCEAGAHL